MDKKNTAVAKPHASECCSRSGIRFPLDQYVGVYARLFPGEMRLFESLGMHPLSKQIVRNHFSVHANTDCYANIGEHSIAVSVAARALAKSLLDANALPRIAFRRILLRGLLHDIYKPIERMCAHATRRIDLPCPHLYTQQLLQEQKLPSYLLQEILTAGKETGHENLRSYLEISSEQKVSLVKGRLQEKIVFLADALTFTSIPEKGEKTATFYLPAKTRVESSAKRYPFLFNAGLIVNELGEIDETTDVNNRMSSWRNIGSFVELQSYIALEIAKEFAGILLPGENICEEEAEDLMLRLIEIELLEPRQ